MTYEELCLHHVPHRIDELRNAVQGLVTEWGKPCTSPVELLALLEKLDELTITVAGRVLALRTQIAWSLSRVALDVDRSIETPGHDNIGDLAEEGVTQPEAVKA